MELEEATVVERSGRRVSASSGSGQLGLWEIEAGRCWSGVACSDMFEIETRMSWTSYFALPRTWDLRYHAHAQDVASSAEAAAVVGHGGVMIVEASR